MEFAAVIQNISTFLFAGLQSLEILVTSIKFEYATFRAYYVSVEPTFITKILKY